VTSDNPRSEDPARILEEIKRGVPASTPLVAMVDRHEAIDFAIRTAEPGDLVLLAGKGHEKTQVIGTMEVPFDDVQKAREALQRRRAGSRVH
jgi:UDP-N-acetylmuramoyl-L-alanyl-D-glutamate--2,6-diaminopimelate ligase